MANWLWSDYIVGNSSWSTEFSFFHRDERALGDETDSGQQSTGYSAPGRRGHKMYPGKTIYSEFVYRVRNYYRPFIRFYFSLNVKPRDLNRGLYFIHNVLQYIPITCLSFRLHRKLISESVTIVSITRNVVL
jgi:hypothetical protein